jgi:hypothetical protein
VPNQLAVSATNRFVTFFPDEFWPPSTAIRVQINGDLIRAADGDFLDANFNGIGGGSSTTDFSTLPLTRIANTHVFGFVYDSFNNDPDGSDIPIVGATIRVDAFGGECGHRSEWHVRPARHAGPSVLRAYRRLNGDQCAAGHAVSIGRQGVSQCAWPNDAAQHAGRRLMSFCRR